MHIFTSFVKQILKASYMFSVADPLSKVVKSSSSRLSREDIVLYGIHPKLDNKYISICDMCGKIVLPVSFNMHNIIAHRRSSPPQEDATYVAPAGTCRSGSPDQEMPPPPIPGCSSNKKKYASSKHKKKFHFPPSVPLPPLFPVSTIYVFVCIVSLYNVNMLILEAIVLCHV